LPPQSVEGQAAPQAAGKPVEPTSTQPAPAASPAPSGTAPSPKPSSKTAPPVARTPSRTAQAPKSAAPPAASQAAPVPLDLIALKEQLKATKAIGVFTKISLKNQVDDLMNKFRDYYQGKSKTTMAELRRSYDLLMMKVLSLLQDSDKKLASEVVSSREAIWALLSDPKKFATLQT
jgi:hypothetical protein